MQRGKGNKRLTQRRKAAKTAKAARLVNGKQGVQAVAAALSCGCG